MTASPSNASSPSPWHKGEMRLQDLVLGQRAASEHRKAVGTFIRSFMPQQHIDFYQEVPWLITASLDPDGWPRASILQRGSGVPLFSATDGGYAFHLDTLAKLEGDRIIDNLEKEGSPFGMLGIQLHTRRRNRVNGHRAPRSADSPEGTVRINVEHAFGNCPKYITARPIAERLPEEMETYSRVTSGSRLAVVATEPSTCAGGDLTDVQGVAESLSDQVHKAFDKTSSFFIASGSLELGVDVSHRGGPPGFVKVSRADDGGVVVRFPDYVGNGHFNTLGNVIQQPRVGLLCVDFGTGAVTQSFGSARVLMHRDETLPGSERVVEVHIAAAETTRGALRLAFGAGEESPFNPPSTPDAGDALRLVAVAQETSDMRTLHLQLSRPMRYSAGQYGTFSVTRANAPPGEEPVVRAWTLSSTPHDGPFGDQHVAITVKRKPGGAASELIHNDAILPGLRFRLMGITGEFTLPQQMAPGRTLLFAAAGSGITPVMSMLRTLRHSLPGVRAAVLYVVRTPADVAFHAELRALASEDMRIAVAFTGLTGEAVSNIMGDVSQWYRVIIGRPTDATHLKAVLDDGTEVARAYACGPGTFAVDMEGIVREQLKAGGDIVTESFSY